MKSIAILLVVGLLFGASSAQAEDPFPRTGPRWEIAGGTLLLPAALATTFTIAFAKSPGWFACGWDNTDSAQERACQREQDRQEREAWITGGIVGSLVGAVGIGLIVHGALRLRDVNRAERRYFVTPAQLSQNGYGLLAAGRF